MKKYFGQFLKTLCLIGVLLLAGIGCQAAEYPVKITSCTSESATEVQMKVTFPNGSAGTCSIYRGTKDPAAGGKLSLLDSMSSGSWTSSDWVNWQRSGDKGKIICVTTDIQLDSDAIFYDTTAKLGVTYYYQVVLENGEEILGQSNVASVKTKLSAPELTKAYAKTNKSVILKWTAASKAKGYVLYRKTGSQWKAIKTIKKASTTTYTDKTVKAGKTYQYRIRAYSTVNGSRVYSDYSSAVKVKTKNPTVKGTYKTGSVYGASLSGSKLSQVRRVVQSFKDNYITSGMSDYNKVLAAFRYLRANCTYAHRGWQYNGANTAWGALVYGEAQCSGFARAMKALCDAIGVSCRYVHANSKASNPNHQWVQVKVGGKWYIVDAQGGAFLLGSNTWQNTYGMTWNTKGLPKCSKKDHSKGSMYASIN